MRVTVVAIVPTVPARAPVTVYRVMAETTVPRPPTAATMRLDGGHPALDLVNTVYGQVRGPVEDDVLEAPRDLVAFARRVGLAGPRTRASAAALADARALRDALDATLRARLAGRRPPRAALERLQAAGRAAVAAARLAPRDEDGGVAWTWPASDPHAPVHRLALAALDLLADDAALARLHVCAGCRWLFLDRSRGAGRRWCSMADCGTEAKKRRYVERRRARRARAG
jgi:predicted RNA-binding Zn ribbon-like protein